MNSSSEHTPPGRAVRQSSGVTPLTEATAALDALSALGAGVAVVGPDWRVQYANAAWSEILLAPRASHGAQGGHGGDPAVVGRSLWDALRALRESREEEILRAAMSDGQPRVCRLELPRERGGGLLRLDMRVARATRGGGLVVEVREAPRERRVTQELALRDEENESLREMARAMSAVSDSTTLLRILCEAAIEQCAATVATVTQPQGDEAVCVAASERGTEMCGARFPLAGSLVGEVIETREPVSTSDYGGNVPLVGQLAWREGIGPMLLAPLVAHDQVLGVIGVARDAGAPVFSDRDEQRLRVIADHASLALWKARLFEEARAANQAKANFLATVSHELRTPLTALTGYGELLADEILGPMSQQQHDVIERMRAVTNHLTAMIDEILSYANLEAGRETVRATEVSAGEVLYDLAAVIEPLARQKGIAFEIEIPGRVPTIRTDPDKLRQILVNLGGNAVKFTDRGTVRLTLESTSHPACVRFRVSDSGIGIAPDDQQRPFQPFVQLDGGLTRRHGGTGLGLYIARRLAQLLGGHIELESEMGRGSAFTLVLPERYERRD